MRLLSRFPPRLKRALRTRWNACRYRGVTLGSGTYVQRGVRLTPGLVAGPDCAILREAELLEGVRLAERVVIGARSRLGHAAVGSDGTLEPGVELYHSTLAAHVQVQRQACITDVRIGRCTYVGRHAYLNLVTVGAFCSIGPQVLAGLGDQPVDRATTSPAFYSTRRQCGVSFAALDSFPERRPVVIGHDVWIGACAFVRDGVTIGDGAIVMAGAVVTHDVPPYAIVTGSPARQVRRRFSDVTIARLLAVAWWDWPEDRLRAAQPHLAGRDIERFLDWAEANAPAQPEIACP